MLGDIPSITDLWNAWSTLVAGPDATATIPPAGSNDLANAVQDLKNVQGDVQQYAPNLSSRWGWLVAQGQALLANNGTAKVTSAVWWQEFKQFLLGLHGLEMQEPNSVTPGSTPPASPGLLATLQGWIPLIAGAIVFAIIVPPLIRAIDD